MVKYEIIDFTVKVHLEDARSIVPGPALDDLQDDNNDDAAADDNNDDDAAIQDDISKTSRAHTSTPR